MRLHNGNIRMRAERREPSDPRRTGEKIKRSGVLEFGPNIRDRILMMIHSQSNKPFHRLTDEGQCEVKVAIFKTLTRGMADQMTTPLALKINEVADELNEKRYCQEPDALLLRNFSDLHRDFPRWTMSHLTEMLNNLRKAKITTRLRLRLFYDCVKQILNGRTTLLISEFESQYGKDSFPKKLSDAGFTVIGALLVKYSGYPQEQLMVLHEVLPRPRVDKRRIARESPG